MFFSSIKNQVQKISSQLFWVIVLITNFCVFNLVSQTKKSDKIFSNCEDMVTGLGIVMNEFVKDAKPGSYLIIIGGAMKGEKPSYNSRRIQESIGYLNSGAKTKNDRIIFGIGNPETKAGYLRFYVNGVLIYEIVTRKNAKMCFGEGHEMKFETIPKSNE